MKTRSRRGKEPVLGCSGALCPPAVPATSLGSRAVLQWGHTQLSNTSEHSLAHAAARENVANTVKPAFMMDAHNTSTTGTALAAPAWLPEQAASLTGSPSPQRKGPAEPGHGPLLGFPAQRLSCQEHPTGQETSAPAPIPQLTHCLKLQQPNTHTSSTRGSLLERTRPQVAAPAECEQVRKSTHVTHQCLSRKRVRATQTNAHQQ